METHELIARLEARGVETDELTRQLIASLKDRQARQTDLDELTARQARVTRERCALIVEAACCNFEIDKAEKACSHLYAMLGVPQ
ncbi:hypothetical protein [Rhizobium tumorigenes]|uniref:hypothetical protein n=1 Tax=Rhizobium tumorigenes TaxID=2041385 RepID=UPI00241D7EEA|nr:hypothetical protein [Rhizobium tumorigenes]WFS02185.1 hypothetical protein PR016_06115 [Rhizobium tumorigenes]